MRLETVVVAVSLGATLLSSAGLAHDPEPADPPGQAAGAYAYVDDYTYIDVLGSLFYESPASVEVGDSNIDFNGDAALVEVSVAVHKNIHLVGQYTNGVSSSAQNVIVGGVNIGKAKVTFESAFGALGWNHTLGERGSVYFEIGGLWSSDNVNLKGGAAGAQTKGTGDEWGFVARSGIRGAPIEKLPNFEMEGQFYATNQALTSNLIYFSGTLRYHVWGGFAPEVVGQVGTDSFAAFAFGLRFFPKQLYQQIVGP